MPCLPGGFGELQCRVEVFVIALVDCVKVEGPRLGACWLAGQQVRTAGDWKKWAGTDSGRGGWTGKDRLPVGEDSEGPGLGHQKGCTTVGWGGLDSCVG